METKLDKLRNYQENQQEDPRAREARNKKKSSKAEGDIITGYEGMGRTVRSMSDLKISKERWEEIFGKKNTKTKSSKKARRSNK